MATRTRIIRRTISKGGVRATVQVKTQVQTAHKPVVVIRKVQKRVR